jgi:hypothetical protein
MMLLMPVGNEKRDQIWLPEGRLESFPRLNGDFFNTIGQKRKFAERPGWN